VEYHEEEKSLAEERQDIMGMLSASRFLALAQNGGKDREGAVRTIKEALALPIHTKAQKVEEMLLYNNLSIVHLEWALKEVRRDQKGSRERAQFFLAVRLNVP
jgi:hypothetical protein